MPVTRSQNGIFVPKAAREVTNCSKTTRIPSSGANRSRSLLKPNQPDRAPVQQKPYIAALEAAKRFLTVPVASRALAIQSCAEPVQSTLVGRPTNEDIIAGIKKASVDVIERHKNLRIWQQLKQQQQQSAPAEKATEQVVEVPEKEEPRKQLDAFETVLESHQEDVHLPDTPQAEIPATSLSEPAGYHKLVGPCEKRLTDAREAEKNMLGIEDFAPLCSCPGAPDDISPYYTHMGSASTLQEIRADFEQRSGFTGRQIRIVKARFCPKEGKTENGCPMAKEIVARIDTEEQILIMVKHRAGHRCQYTYTVAAIIAWEGLKRDLADTTYDYLKDTVGPYGIDVKRRCTNNGAKTCACQGLGKGTHGGSYTFGCNWSLFQDACKYNRTLPEHQENIRLFRLTEEEQEARLEHHFHTLATELNPLYAQLVPHAHHNMAMADRPDNHCRIGFPPSRAKPDLVDSDNVQWPIEQRRPFAAVSAVMDFCAHAHRDLNNKPGGLTMVVTLTKPENRDKVGLESGKVADEQLHVLPHYRVDTSSDEFGDRNGILQQIQDGGIQLLDHFERKLTRRAVPLCAKKRKLINGSRRPQPVTASAEADLAGLGTAFIKVEPKEEPLMVPQHDRNTSPALSKPGQSQPQYMCSQRLPPINIGTPAYVTQVNAAPQPSTGVQETPRCNSSVASEDLDYDIPAVYEKVSNCEKSFQDTDVGGLAFRLSHGSVLFECAKAELHATTALKIPNRRFPSRIGLVFYQHKEMDFPMHGYDVSKERAYLRGRRNYLAWQDGTFVPTLKQLQELKRMGFKFPEGGVEIAPFLREFDHRNIKKPDLTFLANDPMRGVPSPPTEGDWPLPPPLLDPEQAQDVINMEHKVRAVLQDPQQPVIQASSFLDQCVQLPSLQSQSLSDVINYIPDQNPAPQTLYAYVDSQGIVKIPDPSSAAYMNVPIPGLQQPVSIPGQLYVLQPTNEDTNPGSVLAQPEIQLPRANSGLKQLMPQAVASDSSINVIDPGAESTMDLDYNSEFSQLVMSPNPVLDRSISQSKLVPEKTIAQAKPPHPETSINHAKPHLNKAHLVQSHETLVARPRAKRAAKELDVCKSHLTVFNNQESSNSSKHG